MDLDLDNIDEHLNHVDQSALPAIKENIKQFVSLLNNGSPGHGLYLTHTINSLLSEGVITNEFIKSCIDKHFSLNFGDTNKADTLENVRSFEKKDRIMSFFDLSKMNSNLKDKTLYIETVSGWDHTTIILDSDY